MATPDFKRCTSLASQLLNEQNIENRILDIQNLDYGKKKVYFDTIQNYALLTRTPLSNYLSENNNILKDGCTLVLGNDTYLVLYNAEVNNWEHLNWTLAHEIGHIYLEHTCDGDIEEIEAHFFAAQLFMPEYSLYRMSIEHGTITTTDLIEIFGVSLDAADKRIKTMNRKALFSGSSIDKEIWEKQKKRIDLYYKCNKDANNYRMTLEMELEFERYMYLIEYAKAFC